jgi:hypothetical protein
VPRFNVFHQRIVDSYEECLEGVLGFRRSDVETSWLAWIWRVLDDAVGGLMGGGFVWWLGLVGSSRGD